MIYRFTEVLNDLVNYFLLGDILLLEDWKQANHLSDDLAMEFTTNESGDRIFAEGIVIPMTGIENYPYTILFNLSGDRPELCKERNRLQLRKSGYSLKVDHNMDAAVELYGFCPDVIDQGPEDATVGALADVLRQSTVWYFWWD